MQVAAKNRIVGYFFAVHTILHSTSVQNRSLYCRAVCIKRNFSLLQNPRFIIESGFQSRAGYNGTHIVAGEIP